MRLKMGMIGLVMASGAAFGQPNTTTTAPTTPPSSGSTAPQTRTGADESTTIVVYQLTNANSVAVDFAPGSAVLPDAEKNRFNQIISNVNSATTPIRSVFIAAWSDKPAPDEAQKSLPHKDRKLATDRAKAVKAVLQDHGIKHDVDTYNMAEYPSWLARVFNTETAVLKGQGKVNNPEDYVIHMMGEQMRRLGGPGKAVVVLVSQDGGIAH